MTHDALAVTGDEVWRASDRLFVVFLFVIGADPKRAEDVLAMHWILTKVSGVFSIWCVM